MAIGLNIFIIGWTDVLSGFISGSKCAFDRRCERFSREGREAGRTTTRRVLAYKGENIVEANKQILLKQIFIKQTNKRPLLEEYLHIKVKQANIVEANKQILLKQTNKYCWSKQNNIHTRRVLAYKGESNKCCWSKQTNIYLHIKVKQTNIVQANIHQTNKQKFFCEKVTNEYLSVINYYLGCHNVHFRILTLQSKRSQRSLQQIQLRGE